MPIELRGNTVASLVRWARTSFGLAIWALRPRLPMPLLRPIMRLKISRRMRNDQVLTQAQADMRHMMGFVGAKTSTPGDLDSLVRDYITHSVWWNELRWHPRQITGQQVVGIENLRRAHQEGCGVVLSFVHHAQFDGIFKSVARHGFHVATVLARSAMRGTGPNTIQFRRIMGAGGSLISAEEGLPKLLAELSKGHVVATAIDVPGPTVVELGGRKVLCSAGAAVASARSGAPMIVATSRVRDDGATAIHLSEPLYAADFESIDAAAQELVRLHEGALLSRPSATFLPQLAWSSAPIDSPTPA